MTSSTDQIPRVSLRPDVEIPQLGFGVFQVPPAETEVAVARALDAGYRHIDTAAAYRNEGAVGQAINASGPAARGDLRDDEVWNDDHGYDKAKRAFKASLERLELEHVDLYLIHWPVPAHDRYVETWRAFIELPAEGLVRAIGVSNFSPRTSSAWSPRPTSSPAINQVELHPHFQQTGLRDEHAEHGIVTEAWSPLGQGAALEHQ